MLTRLLQHRQGEKPGARTPTGAWADGAASAHQHERDGRHGQHRVSAVPRTGSDGGTPRDGDYRPQCGAGVPKRTAHAREGASKKDIIGDMKIIYGIRGVPIPTTRTVFRSCAAKRRALDGTFIVFDSKPPDPASREITKVATVRVDWRGEIRGPSRPPMSTRTSRFSEITLTTGDFRTRRWQTPDLDNKAVPSPHMSGRTGLPADGLLFGASMVGFLRQAFSQN